jgi:hypothetical protein
MEFKKATHDITNIKKHKKRNKTNIVEKDLAPCRKEVHNQG